MALLLLALAVVWATTITNPLCRVGGAHLLYQLLPSGGSCFFGTANI